MWPFILNRPDDGLTENPKLVNRRFVSFVVHDGVLEYTGQSLSFILRNLSAAPFVRNAD